MTLVDDLRAAYRSASADADDYCAQVIALEARIAAVEEVCAAVEGDDAAHMDRFGQHLPGSVVHVAEMVRAALADPGA